MDVVSYKCPNCAAPLSFAIDAQSWDCDFCGSSFSLPELEGAEKAEEPKTTVEEKGEFAQEGEARAYSCPSCGGRILTDSTTAATFCTFCHNPTVIASQLEGEKRPVRVIPFQLEKAAAEEAMRKFCRKRPLLPADFKEYAAKGEITGLYVPFWLYSCRVDAWMQGEGKRVTTWSDSKYRYTKTDTYRVERAANMAFHNVPADGSSKMDDKLMQALEPFDYSHMEEFSMGYLSGHFAEGYDVDSAQAEQVAYNRIRAGVEGQMRAQVSGYTSFFVKKFHSSSRDKLCEYVMLPVWVVMARYKGKQYTFAMNGQSGKIVGKLPLSMPRLAAWAGAVFGASFLLSFLGGLFL